MNLLKWDSIRRTKLIRLRSGAAPRVLEICSGAGGLSLGLQAAGFELSAHIEIDPEAASTYALNFGPDRDPSDPWCIPRDMQECSAPQLVDDIGLESSAEAFDVLAAGLPCQAFARIGRSKLRSVSGGAEDAFRKDPRASLYRRFLEYVGNTQPLVILLENVPDILNFGGHNVPEEICETLEKAGYRTGYTLLNAAHHGVPQIRERLFLVALADCMAATPRFPKPTRFIDLPRGYEGSRQVALKYVNHESGHYHTFAVPSRSLPRAVGVREALGDLPRIREHVTNPRAIRRRKLNEVIAYGEPRSGLSEYAKQMREWPCFETGEGTNGHLVRLTPRDFPIFAAMEHGADYPEARKLAERLLQEEIADRNLNDQAACDALRKEMVPPYDPSKFPNKWWKLVPTKPSRTLTAHMGKDTYSHIHYDSRQCRTISVREAARLQSFPDGFNFSGAMNAAFRQIGNAVPPLLSLTVARVLKSQLDDAASVAGEVNSQQAA